VAVGKPTGFIEWERILPDKRPVTERVADYEEIEKPFTTELARQQSGRCMDCGVPFCQQGCPLGNPIPDFNDLVYHGHTRQAYLHLASTNDFPEFTGRICPAPCEAACTLSINRDPVTIEQMEKYIAEQAFANGWVKPRPPERRTGRRVAVVGSGPAGLAAASMLNRAGHDVIVYERDDRVGGLLRYGIPDYKLDKRVIDRRLEILEAEGVRFVTGASVGESPTWSRLRDDHDALLIAIGSRRPRDLNVPGRELEGVLFAMDFLRQQNRLVAGDTIAKGERLSVEGEKVIVLGGGDTGSDCIGTAHRQGAASIVNIELFPEPPKTRREGNPWPQWPMILRTSSSHDEGGEREFALLTKRLEGEGGKLKRLVATHVRVEEGKLAEEGDEVSFDVDRLILAMGFVGPDTSALTEQLDVDLDARGNIATPDGAYATTQPGVFAAGDARRGQSLVVWALMEGREAARAIDAKLRGHRSALPTRGVDLHFGGR
jgi:glutamate synthase (NADPH/NADH) small chain